MLRFWSRLIDSRFPVKAAVDDAREDRALARDVRRLQRRLAFQAEVYAGVEAAFGIETTAVFEDADNALEEVVAFLEEHLPQREGRTPDDRRPICARVCLVLWRRQHGETPYSPTLWEVCELYWQACGNPATGDNLDNWRRYLKPASEAPPK
jgi:hypothetical protein